jgi:YHS domain-containing protein
VDQKAVFKVTSVLPYSGKGLGYWFCKEHAKAKFQGYPVGKMQLLETLGLKWREAIPTRLRRHAVIDEEAKNEDADDLAMTTNSAISPFTVPSPSEETDDPVPNKEALQDKSFTIDPTWMTLYNEAKELHNRHAGHLPVSSENSRLYEWIRRQRRAQAKGGYPSEKKDLLDRLGFQCRRIPVIQPP